MEKQGSLVGRIGGLACSLVRQLPDQPYTLRFAVQARMPIRPGIRLHSIYSRAIWGGGLAN
jgi:hypothetical protein